MSSFLIDELTVGESVEVRGEATTFDNDRDCIASLLVTLVQKGVPICGIYERQFDVEDIFMQLGAEKVS